eukprot:7654524-Ditylum_brightwellii.AAC.1
MDPSSSSTSSHEEMSSRPRRRPLQYDTEASSPLTPPWNAYSSQQQRNASTVVPRRIDPYNNNETNSTNIFSSSRGSFSRGQPSYGYGGISSEGHSSGHYNPN